MFSMPVIQRQCPCYFSVLWLPVTLVFEIKLKKEEEEEKGEKRERKGCVGGGGGGG